MTGDLPLVRRLFAGAAALGAFAGVGACLPGFAAEPGGTGAPPGSIFLPPA